MKVTRTALPRTWKVLDQMAIRDDERGEIMRNPLRLVYPCGCWWSPGEDPRKPDHYYDAVCFRHEVMAIAESEQRETRRDEAA